MNFHLKIVSFFLEERRLGSKNFEFFVDYLFIF